MIKYLQSTLDTDPVFVFPHRPVTILSSRINPTETTARPGDQISYEITTIHTDTNEILPNVPISIYIIRVDPVTQLESIEPLDSGTTDNSGKYVINYVPTENDVGYDVCFEVAIE